MRLSFYAVQGLGPRHFLTRASSKRISWAPISSLTRPNQTRSNRSPTETGGFYPLRHRGAEVGRNSPPASASASAVVGRAIHPGIESTGASPRCAAATSSTVASAPPCSSPCRLCLFLGPPQETTLSRRQFAGRFLQGIYVASPSSRFSSWLMR